MHADKPKTPAAIARKLGISTSALRNYEEWGLVPPVSRGANGYRQYTEEHELFFACLRAMAPGFGMEVTRKVLERMVDGRTVEALLLVNDAQAELHRKRVMAERTIQVLETVGLPADADARKKPRRLTIGEAARETAVAPSAIRHWEAMGLIQSERDASSGYRTFGPAQVRQILIIGTLRQAIWSLDVIREILQELDQHNIEQARRVARKSVEVLNELNALQMRGIGALYRIVELRERNSG